MQGTTIERECSGTSKKVLSHEKESTFCTGVIELSKNGFAIYTQLNDLPKWEKKVVQKSEKDLKRVGVLDGDDKIIGVYMETGLENFMEELLEVEQGNEDQVMQVHSRELYSAIQAFQDYEVEVETKYKTVERKIKPVAIPLPSDSNHQVQQALKEKVLRDPKQIGHKFTKNTLNELKIGSANFLLLVEEMEFRKMLSMHGKAFAFEP